MTSKLDLQWKQEDTEIFSDLKSICTDGVHVVFFRYKAVIDACSLQPDIDLLPFGDQTEIGERVRSFFTYYFIDNSLYLPRCTWLV